LLTKRGNNGVLTIRTIQGRNGPFNVGRLITDLGEFAVKDTLLEQHEEGRYEGSFNVTQIFPSSYVAGGRFVVEVRATLKSLILNGINEFNLKFLPSFGWQIIPYLS